MNRMFRDGWRGGIAFAPDGGGAGAGAGGGAPWYQGIEGVDAELTGHLQSKGWDKLEPAKAAAAAARAHRQAEGLIGAPADQIIRLPKENNDPAWNSIWQRLGRPADDKGYDFSGVKDAAGQPISEALAAAVRAAAFKANLTKDGAIEVARAVVALNDKSAADAKAETDAAVALERQELDKSWGANKAANMLIATNAFKALLAASGLSQEKYGQAMTALENTVGYAGLHQILLAVGQKIGEDKFIGGRGPSGDGVMTREQAVARKAELMKDAAWTKRYLDGGAAEQREMLTLNRLITG